MTEMKPPSSGHGLRRACMDVLDAAQDVAAADFADIRLVEPQTDGLRLFAQRGFPAAWEEFWAADAFGPGLCLLVAQRGARLIVEDVDDSPLIAQMPSTGLLRRIGVRGLQSTPIVARSGTILGTFATYSRTRLRIDPRALRLLDLLARQMADVIERSRAEETLDRAEDRRRFLAELEDALRPLVDPAAIEYEACRRLAERLDVARACFVQIDEAAGSLRIDRDFARAGAVSIAGAHRMTDHAWAMPILRTGTTIVVGDLRASALVPQTGRAALARLGTAAVVSVPVVKQNRLVGALSASNVRHRDWTTSDIETVRDIGERIWAARERARAEEARQANLSLCRSVFENAPIGIAIKHRDGRIESANPCFCTLLGYELDELRSLAPWALIHPDDQATNIAEIERLWSAGTPPRQLDHRYIRKSGQPVWIRRWIAAIPGGRSFIVLVTDIVERGETEEMQARAQRIEALAQLSGGIAHDFNNLLMTISLNLEMAEAQAGTTILRGRIHRAQDAVQQGASLTRRLLSFAQRRILETTRFDVNDRVRDIVQLLRRSLGEQIELAVDIASDPQWIEADPGEIDSALINLAINARDAMPNGGKLSIVVDGKVLDDAEAASAGLPRGPYARITLLDTGAGMAPQILRRATEPFFTTKPHGSGTGLGLSSVHGFVRQSGGSLGIESEAGRGTKVVLLLPRAQTETVRPAPTDTPILPAGKGERILVIEDHDELRHAVVEHLRSLGYDAQAVDRGAGALTILERDRTIRLALSDVVMPGGVDGFDVARWVASNRPDVKILLVSGNMANDPRRDAHPHLRVLTKPYRILDLAEALHDMLADDRPRRSRRGATRRPRHPGP